MADHHRHHYRPNRILLTPRATTPTFTATTTTPRPPYPLYPPSTPTPTPSKHRLSSSLSSKSSSSKRTSLSFLFLLLFSLRSLYSLLPFIRSSPSSFSIFPFSFLVSLLSFLLSLSFSFFSTTPFQNQTQPIFPLASINASQHRLLLTKSLLLAVIFLLRFQALRYCGTAALILAEFSGNVAARFVADSKNRSFAGPIGIGSSKVRGFVALITGLFLLSISWDRIECFPLSLVNTAKFGFSLKLKENCVRIWPMLLPFLSGFLGCYERVSMNWGSVRELGRKQVRLVSLFFTTVVLFFPAVISMFVFEIEGDSFSLGNLGWPLANTVVFGVLLSENFTDEKLASSKDFRREFFVTFICTLILELFYFPELSLFGLLICGLLLGVAVKELDPVYLNNLELGLESSGSFSASILKPIRHILSERKSRKIALFLLINTAYMVVEFVVGFMSNSLGLISDACHMLFDCAALAIGLYASYISRLPANSQFNYGRGRFEVLSGYVNAVFLVLVGALIVVESFERILDPQEISTSSLLTVSIGGLLVNVVGLIFFHEEHHHAHGGSGSCSHSHSHHQHSHDHIGNDQSLHIHQDCITVIHGNNEKSGHDAKCGDNHMHKDDCHHSHNAGGHKSSQCCGHDHNSHEHQHENPDHHHHHQPHHHHQHEPHSHQHHQHEHHDDDHHSADTIADGSLSVSDSFQDHTLANSKYLGLKSTQPDKVTTQKQHHHHHIDHNMEGIFLHVLADTLGSVGVVISTVLIRYKGWLAADPVCSIFISVLIVSSVIPLLRNSAEILLQRVPRAHEHDLRDAVGNFIKMKGVRGIQNLHVWSFTNNDVVGTLHLHVSAETNKSSAKAQVSDLLHDAGVKDVTVQVECVKNR